MKTVDIKGKDYVMVNERIKFFRENYPDWQLVTDIVELNENFCVLNAVIKNHRGEVVATGLAREVNGDTYINKTSYVENCETSAWGRALGNMGIGIDASVASAEEVANAINNQNKSGNKPEPKQGFQKNTKTQPQTSRDTNLTDSQKAKVQFNRIILKDTPTDDQKDILTGIHDTVKKHIPSKYACCVRVYELMDKKWPNAEQAAWCIDQIQSLYKEAS